MSWNLSTHITQHMIKPRMGDARQTSLWPSEATAVLTNAYGEPEVQGACRRHTYLRYLRDMVQFDPNLVNPDYVILANELTACETQPDKYMRWIWAAGNLFEDFVIEQAKQSGVWCADQVQVVIPEVHVVGKLDLIVVNPDTGNFIAEEIKSIYGHNSTGILGSPGMHNKSQSGTPRESNLMQIAIYDWHLRKRMPDLEVSRLFYGARDTGRFGEFDVVTNTEPDGTISITYQMVSPFRAPKVKSSITINNILDQYRYVIDHFNNNQLPPRDYDLIYSEEKIEKLYSRGELGKGDTETYEKALSRKQENQDLVSQGKAPKKELRSVEKGSWHCELCSFKLFCYDATGKPRHG